MKARRTFRGFSLVEVVIAVGVFAVGVGAILLLVPSLAKHGAESADFVTAQQLPDALRVELRRVAETQGFDQLASSLPLLESPLANGREFVAARDGVRLHAVDSPPNAGALSPAEQYFLIECWSFATEPLAPSATKAFLATYVRVSWPYRVGSGGAVVTTSPESRNQFTFACGINR